jgi:hypothetical protein
MTSVSPMAVFACAALRRASRSPRRLRSAADIRHGATASRIFRTDAVAADEHHVDRELHEEGMDGVRGAMIIAAPFRQLSMLQEPRAARGGVERGDQTICQDDARSLLTSAQSSEDLRSSGSRKDVIDPPLVR